MTQVKVLPNKVKVEIDAENQIAYYTLHSHEICKTRLNNMYEGAVEKQDDEYLATYVCGSTDTVIDKYFKTSGEAQSFILAKMDEAIKHNMKFAMA